MASLDVAEQTGGGFELDGACGLQMGCQFARDLGAADAQDFRPAKVVAGRYNEATRRETAFDMGGGMDGERATSLPMRRPLMTASPTRESVLRR